jgi:hypothetical protein
VLDGSGFVRRSRTFAGNVSEGTTLQDMLTGLSAPPAALVVMDAGIASEANVAWLVEHGYRYLVVRRGGQEIRRFPYDAWLAWQVFFPPLPALFYFREQNSPHLLPMLFEATALRQQLERHVRLPAAVNPNP